MRLIFFALLGANVAALVLQLTVWQPPGGESQRVDAPAPQGESLVLLSERDGPAQSPAPDRRPPISLGTNPQERDSDREQLCDMVGPFSRLLKAEYFVEALAAHEVMSQVRQVEVPEGAGFWVHLPPAPSKKQALQRLREVQAKQIDSYLIPRGDLANGISFGMFTREALALARRDEMRELGYGAEIREITRTRQEIWVVLEPGQANKIADETWAQLLARENGVEKQQNYCSGVASG